jgi:large subunit ribosomal protein L25
MKAAVQFKAETRASAGKGAARAARRAGHVPVAIYGKDKQNLSLNVEARVLANEYFRGGFMNKIVSFQMDGKEVFAIPRDIQLNPVSDKIEHADFQHVDDKSVVKVRVPVHFLNAEKSIGIKRGGVLNIVSHEVELLCRIANIPASVDIDILTLDIGHSIHINTVKLPDGATPASKRDITIASIAGRQEEEPTAQEAAAATAAAAVPASTAKAPAAGAAAPAGGAKAAPAAKPAAKK